LGDPTSVTPGYASIEATEAVANGSEHTYVIMDPQEALKIVPHLKNRGQLAIGGTQNTILFRLPSTRLWSDNR